MRIRGMEVIARNPDEEIGVYMEQVSSALLFALALTLAHSASERVQSSTESVTRGIIGVSWLDERTSFAPATLLRNTQKRCTEMGERRLRQINDDDKKKEKEKEREREKHDDNLYAQIFVGFFFFFPYRSIAFKKSSMLTSSSCFLMTRSLRIDSLFA
jgi:hypothetical protein